MSRDRWLVLAALAGWLVIAIVLAAFALPLKHDEARYAVAARGDASWLYAPSGTVALAKLGLALAGAPRLAAIVANAGIVLAAWALGRAAFGARVGAYAAAVIAGAHPFVLLSADLGADLPAAACAVCAIAVVVGELERSAGPTWRLVAAAPACAAAFYLRYGHAPLVAIIALAAVAVYPRQLAARPRIVVVTLAVFAALLVPHVLASSRATGSPLGILELSAHVPARAYVGEGLVGYLTTNPCSQFGVLGAPLVVAALAGVAGARTRWRAPVFLVAIAVAQLVVLGLQTRAQPRYVYVATVLLVVAGIDTVVRAVPARIAGQAERSGLALVALAWFGVATAVAPVARHRARARAPLANAGEAIRADAAGRPCVVAARQVPQLVWTTGCAGVVAAPPIAWPADRVRYLVALPGDGVEPAATGEPLDVVGVGVWRLAP